MLFSSLESLCSGKSDGVFDFVLKLAERPLFLKFTHRELRNYRAGKTRFWRPSLYSVRLGTQYGRIRNQHHSANTVTPSLVSLGKINSLYFWGFPTRVIKFVNRFCIGVQIVL